MSVTDQNREELEKKVANAKHMSKPNADNAVVVRDADGRWLFEIYTVGHTITGTERQQTA
jgi:hypothetical protein